MRKILPSDIEALLVGSTLFGTGGGGTPLEAREIYSDLFAATAELPLASLEDIPTDGVLVSAFGVGSAAGRADVGAVSRAFNALAERMQKRIHGVVPVEIGPKSIATAAFLAHGLGVPTLDADIVGGRSTPEVFLETITLYDIPRTPLAVANERGEVELLCERVSPLEEERFLRDFAARSGGQAYVVGYPLSPADLERAVETGTVSAALEAGQSIIAGDRQWLSDRFGMRSVFSGAITAIVPRETSGFLSFDIVVRNSADEARVFIKNENLIVWRNGEVTLTCPDLIVLLNRVGRPLYNTELTVGLEVEIVGLPAAPRWQTVAGRELFNPRTFGFDAPVRLLAS